MISGAGNQSAAGASIADSVLFFWLTMSLLVSPPLVAEEGVLMVQVSHGDGYPLEGIVIGTQGLGSMETTDGDGKAWIQLPEDIYPGDPVTLLVRSGSEDPCFFVRPADGRTRVPRFGKGPERFVSVVLIRKSERAPAVDFAGILSRLPVCEERAYEELRQVCQQQLDALRDAIESLANQRDDPEAPAGIDEALKQLELGETRAAERIFKDVLEHRRQEAAQAQQEAAQAQHEAAEAARHLGALALLHDTDRAILFYREAVSLDPENPEGWTQLGHLLFRLGELSESKSAHQRVVALGKSSRDQRLQAVGFGNLGVIYQTQGDLEQAEDMFRSALTIYEQLDELEGMGAAYGSLGLIYRTRGYLKRAEDMLHKSLAIDEQLGRLKGMAATYGNLGLIYQTQEDMEQAEAMHRRALAISERLGWLENIAMQKGNLGLIYKTREDLEQAEAKVREALEISKRLGWLRGMAIQYGNLGLIYQKRGDLEQAETKHRKALAINEDLGRLRGMAVEYWNLGLIYQTREDLEQALAFWTKSRDCFAKLGASQQVQRLESLLSSLPEEP